MPTYIKTTSTGLTVEVIGAAVYLDGQLETDHLVELIEHPNRAAIARAVPDAQSDILNALLALGYSDKEALLALKNVPVGSGVSDGIKLALKALSKG